MPEIVCRIQKIKLGLFIWNFNVFSPLEFLKKQTFQQGVALSCCNIVQ